MWEIIQGIIALFIIIDPFLSMAMFLALTKGQTRAEMKKQALTAVGVASVMLLLFLVGGLFLLNLMSISFESFKIGGGVILLMLGIRTCLGKGFATPAKYKVSIVVIGTPMLSGPGALTTIIILSQQSGIAVAAIASVVVLVLTFFILYYASYFQKWISEKMMEVFSRVMGLLLTALAVQYIVEGITMIIRGG